MTIQVYRNLHNHKLSLKDKATGLVLGHCEGVILGKGIHAKVNQKGRERVLRERKKYVHAVLEGSVQMVKGFVPYKGRELCRSKDSNYLFAHYERHHHCMFDMQELAYNPYKNKEFTNKATGQEVTQADYAIVLSNGRMWAA